MQLGAVKIGGQIAAPLRSAMQPDLSAALGEARE
jgi:hypothetical protein